jgi:predicted  nucleic acid-binding Zn-ribbon protein
VRPLSGVEAPGYKVPMARAKGGSGRVGSKSAKMTESGFTVILERIEEQKRATIEAVFTVERRLTAKMEAQEQRLLVRIEALEFAVRRNSEEVRKNSEDILALSKKVEALAEELRRKPDEAALRALEQRVARLEERVGIQR